MLRLGSSASRASVVAGWSIGLASFVYLLAYPPTLGTADESYLLYGAKRVLQGQALYRDFFDFQTPGSFYLYAAAYLIGGVSITTARVTTALLNGVSATCTYFLARHVASTAEALLAGMLVAVVCVPVWNMASHHWVATTFGLASASVLLASRWRGSSRIRPAAAGALAAMLVCTQQSRGIAFMLWLAIAVPALALAGDTPDRRRRWFRELAWTGLGGAALCVPVLGYAAWRSSVGELLYATHTWVITNYRSYNVGRTHWSGYSVGWAEGVPYTWPWLLQSMPVILAVEAASLVWAIRRDGVRAQVVRGLVLLLALAVMGGIAYYPDVIHVAFVAPYGLAVVAGMAFRTRSALASGRPLATPIARVALAGLAAVIVAKGWQNVRLAWAQNPVLYETAFGTLAGWPQRAAALRDLQQSLNVDAHTPPRVFAYQSDAWLYLTLPSDNPTPFALLRPVYNTPEQIQLAIDRLERDRDARVVVNLLAPEPGDPFMAYVNANYRDVAGAGPIVRGAPLYRVFERRSRG